METPQIDFDAIFADVTQGDKHALEFLQMFLRWVHLIDDTIDGDRKDHPEYIVGVNLEFCRVLSFNPFWEKHKVSLFPIILQSARAFGDSIRWAERSDFRDRASADVLKSQYQDVWFHVAFLVGGYHHLALITERHRIYDYDSKGQKPA